VAWFRPLRIIPSVGNDRGAKLQQMLATLQQAPQPRAGPMDAFVRQQQQQPAAAAGGAAAAAAAAAAAPHAGDGSTRAP
jgi:hypothetical protein